MKYLKLLFDLRVWHLIPYKMPVKQLCGSTITEMGFLFVKIVITWK